MTDNLAEDCLPVVQPGCKDGAFVAVNALSYWFFHYFCTVKLSKKVKTWHTNIITITRVSTIITTRQSTTTITRVNTTTITKVA